jgi:hypothetical protein
MVNITDVLATLAQQRSIFHSEADFQHALAWELHNQLPNAAIRLELPVAHRNKLLHVDIWIVQNEQILALELKYKTRALVLPIGDETFKLLNQSAQDFGRYDFIKDLQRLELLLADRRQAIGYAILLTNDSSYWTPPRDAGSIDADFRVPDGRMLHGVLQWKAHASVGTMRGREAPLEISGTYPLRWDEYAQPTTKSYGRFRYLAIKVQPLLGA